jgi:hypothetical protein
MTTALEPAAVACSECPLRRLPLFLDHSAEEVELVQSLKRAARGCRRMPAARACRFR